MIERIHRCVKCKTRYTYQASGYGCDNPLNDDRYCPDCMKLINKALKNVEVKFHSEYLPVLDDYPNKITVEEFDKRFEEYKKNSLVLYPIHFGFDGQVYDLRVGNINYRKYVGKNGDVIITAEYEVNNKDEVTGLW